MDKQQTTSYYTLYHFFRERFVLPARQWLYRLVRMILMVFIVVSVLNFIFAYYFNTPKTYRLREQVNQVVHDYQLLQGKLAVSMAQLAELRERDHAVYRAIFSADTLQIPGIYTSYPDSKYQDIGYGRYTPLITETWKQMDAFARELYLQSVSYDQLEKLAVDKDLMAEVVPAIMPVDQKQVTGRLGAFGSRINPVTKQYQRQHDGIDLPGRTGTPIYATGTGLVVAPEGRGTGYGLQVVVDHGFGYRTRYAHLSKILVAPGQLVKRGEVIAEMGNTGRSSGSHLHYEVIYRGKPVDPINYISRDMSEEEFQNIIESATATTYELDE